MRTSNFQVMSVPFPATIEVSGCLLIDGTYHLAEPGNLIRHRWGFVYTRSDAAWVLCYGEQQPELGGPGCVGWAIGRLLPSAAVEVVARCVKKMGDPANDFEWERKQTDGSFLADDKIAARPVASADCSEGLLPCPPQPPSPPVVRLRGVKPGNLLDASALGGVEAVTQNRVIWKLQVLKDRLKHCSPGCGISSEFFSLEDGTNFRFVLYPFGTTGSPAGCVSLGVESMNAGNSKFSFSMRIGNALSGAKTFQPALGKFHVDFGRAAVIGEGGRKLEGLEAEIRQLIL